jgi:hypothetical protein
MSSKSKENEHDSFSIAPSNPMPKAEFDKAVKFARSIKTIEIYSPPDDVCPWGHRPIVKHPTDKTYGQMFCTVCRESFQGR